MSRCPTMRGRTLPRGTMESANILFALTFAAALGAALVAGVFYAFSSFVMPGLKRLPAPEAIAAMQSINVTAVTPAFMAGFMGTAALSLVVGVWGGFRLSEAEGPWLLAGGVLYLVGTFGLTAAYHVPRNHALVELDPHSAEASPRWQHYYAEWTRWNHVRGLAALAASAAFVAALLEM